MASSRYRIGFITLEAINSYTTQLWLGVNDCAEHLDLNLITFGGFGKALNPNANVSISDQIKLDPVGRLVDLQSLDGVLVWTAGILKDHAYAEQLLVPFRSIPLVSIGVDTPGVACAVMDAYQGMVDLTSHLITNCGRRNIAFITGTPTNLDSQKRQQAYEDILRLHGLPIRQEYIVPGAFAWNSREIGRQAAQELIEKRQLRPDAIVAASDDLAIGALEWLRDQGIRVPDEISVTGFDDIPDCMSVYPALTTVLQNTYDLAWRSVELLLAQIEGKAVAERVLIPTKLIIRNSCGARRTKTLQNSQQELAVSANSKPTEDNKEARQKLVDHLHQVKPDFRMIFAETFPDIQSGKIDEIFDTFQWSALLTEPDYFVNALQSLIYKLKERRPFEKFMNSLLIFTAGIAKAVAVFDPLDPQSQRKGMLVTSLDLMTTRLELIFEQALSSLDREQHVRDQYQLAQLQMVNRNLLIPYDPQRFAEIFAEQLPQLGIDLAYVALFTSFEQPTEDVRLVIAYDRQRALAEAPVERILRVAELSTGLAILQDRHLNLVISPIQSANIYAGFVVFAFGPRNYQFYTQLCSTLGYNIVNSTLLQQMRMHASQLEVGIHETTDDLLASNRQLQAEIAERIRIEHELEAARDQAIEVSRLKSEFLATMSHEIRTPMNGILGMTEMLLDSTLDEEQHSFAEIAYEEGHKLLEIINSILDFSKIEAGKVTLEEVEFVLADEVQSVIKLLRPKANNKGLTLLSTITPNVPQRVIGDPVRFGQILRNLVSNAIKFTENGEVFVTVQGNPEQSTALAITGEEIQVPLQISVRDTGIGISPAAMESLFRPFTQADSSTTRNYGGTGLGLAITKRLVDLQGGKITVESTPHVGSIFTVRLSYRCRYANYRSAIEKRTPTTPRCLIVSNDPALYRQLSGYLEAWSISATPFAESENSQSENSQSENNQSQTRTSGNNNVAVVRYLYEAIAQNIHYTSLIIDQQTTRIDPFAFARSIHADSLLRQSHLLLISTKQSAPFRQQVLEAGFDGILAPPVTQSALYQQVSHLIPTPYSNLSGFEDTQTVQVAAVVAPPADPPGKLILLVEDYVNNQRVALAYLKKLGYAAHVVEDGQSAVDAITRQGHPYQLVLMDWHLPGMDGLQATELIREHEAKTQRHIPIIGMTANAVKGDRERCLAAGMDDYISKPMRREELGRLLKQWYVESNEA